MRLNMYHGETEVQRNSMNAVCIELIQAMERTKASINAFALSFNLQGKTYQTAKMYMTEIYLPLAQGIIYLGEELIRQNDRFPSDFKADVSPMDVNEDEVREQLREVEQLRASLERMQDQLAILGISIPIYERLEQELKKKLDMLYQYDYSAGSNYNTAAALAAAIAQGLAQLEGNDGFNPGSVTFDTGKKHLGWVEKIDTIHFQRKAKEGFAAYLQEHPHDMDKIGEILKYEATNKSKGQELNDMLATFELRDIVGIKYSMYTASEPYRSLALAYVGDIQVEKLSTNIDAYFSSDKNMIHYHPNQDRSNGEIGDYSTFFHELGHAVDHNHAQTIGVKGYFSKHYQTNGMTLAEYMHVDVEKSVRQEIAHQCQLNGFESLSATEQEEMADRVVDVLNYGGPNRLAGIDLTDEKERELLERVSGTLGAKLEGYPHYVAADVFSGVTGAQVQGSHGYQESHWNDPNTLEKKDELDTEGFASYFGTYMVQGSVDANGEMKELRADKIASVEEYLPASKKHMDQMIQAVQDDIHS